jgi:hypothetical protein
MLGTAAVVSLERSGGASDIILDADGVCIYYSGT